MANKNMKRIARCCRLRIFTFLIFLFSSVMAGEYKVANYWKHGRSNRIENYLDSTPHHTPHKIGRHISLKHYSY